MLFRRKSLAVVDEEVGTTAFATGAGSRADGSIEPGWEDRISSIATASIALSKMAPKLASLASEMAEGAELQARESTVIAQQAIEMSKGLEVAIESLKDSSASVGGIVQSIKRLADQSKILAINASIEAANAGAMGRAFGAVATEVESLAVRTSTATSDVSAKVGSIESSIQKAVTAAGLGSCEASGDADLGGLSIRGIGEKVEAIASVARQNSASASFVAETGREVRSLCEDLLLTVGTFRIEAHDRAARIFDGVASGSCLVGSGRLEIERYLREQIRQFGIFELFYMTDENGVQLTENIWSSVEDGRASALGRDWSARGWFAEALGRRGRTCVSDIYLSAATGSFCFTVSKTVCRKSGEVIGVLAADVNFGSLMETF